MVALKRASSPGALRRIHESRNAVVALKRRLQREGRGGLPRKQERRGGIETGLGDLWNLGRIGESRNAVVALKRSRAAPSGSRAPGKAGTPWWH